MSVSAPLPWTRRAVQRSIVTCSLRASECLLNERTERRELIKAFKESKDEGEREDGKKGRINESADA